MLPLTLRHPSHWALLLLALSSVAFAALLVRIHHERARRLYQQHFGGDIPRERLLFASLGFYIGFAGIRTLTHLIRAHIGPFHDVAVGGRHIHHLVWGILLLLLVGYCWLWQVSLRGRLYGRLLSFAYGVGAALTLDEFALWLNLRDVYWDREGRASIDALLLFGALLSVSYFGGPFVRSLSREALSARR